MSVAVYTAVYGGYDEPKPLERVEYGWLFSDEWYQQSGWFTDHQPHNIVTRKGDPAVTAPMLAHKYWKTHPAEAVGDVDISIWVDASITLGPDFVAKALVALGDDDWVMVRHPWRDCIFDEAAYSATLPRYHSLAADLRAQAAWYKEIGHPTHWGLPATGLNVRRHTPAVLEMSHHWWMECLNWTHQDQVSLPVLMRMYEDKIRFNWNIGWLDGWELWPHLK